MRTIRRFTDEEDAYIKANIGELGCTAVARHLGRNPASIVSRANTLGLRTPNRTVSRFTAQEDRFIRRNAGKISLQRIAEHLGRSPGSVWGRGIKLNVWFNRKQRTARPMVTSSGYVRIPVEDNGKRRWSLEHVHLVEQSIGRRLRPGEQIHHINLNTTDNRSANLYLCSSGAAHNRAHASLSRLVEQLLERGAIRFNADRGVYELCETGS